MDLAVFGCSLDALDAEERVAVKLAYLYAVRQGVVDEDIARDPYDMLVESLSALPDVSVAGRLELESWLTPRPAPGELDRVDPALYREFIDTGGCAVICARLREYVKERVLPLRPLLVGVDHSLTGGVLDALLSAGQEPALIVLDSHFDAIPTSVRMAAVAASGTEVEPEPIEGESYNCGTWLAGVIERELVAPHRVAVLGVSDHPGYESFGEGESAAFSAYRHAYLAFEESGVTVVSKKRLRLEGIRATVSDILSRIGAGPVYVSLDADVGAGENVGAVRFLDTIGLEPAEVVEVGKALHSALDGAGAELSGMDIMEIDAHLADIPGSGDCTLEMCLAFAREMLGK